METAETTDLRERYDLPPAVSLQAERGTILAFQPEFEEALRRLAENPDQLKASPLGGRAPLLVLPAGDERLLARPYRKGGLLRHLRGKRFRGDLRPLRELSLHVRLQAMDVPVVDAVGALVQQGTLGWQGFLVTREVLGSSDLEQHLKNRSPASTLPLPLILPRAGAAVRQMHDAGVSHADLHAKNLLVDREGRVLVLDLDRATSVDGPLDEGGRLRNLARMGRAIVKQRANGMPVARGDVMAFLEGYTGDRTEAEAWFRRIRERVSRGLRLRRLWWCLTGETPCRRIPAGESREEARS